MEQEQTSVETWKEIQGFPAYLVSDLGRVKRIRDDGVLNQFSDRGTTCVKLRTGLPRDPGVNRQDAPSRKEIKCAVYLLVASAFLSKPCGSFLPMHKDGDRTNNRADNLRYLTSATKRRLRRDKDNKRRREKNRMKRREAERAAKEAEKQARKQQKREEEKLQRLAAFRAEREQKRAAKQSKPCEAIPMSVEPKPLKNWDEMAQELGFKLVSYHQAVEHIKRNFWDGTDREIYGR